VTRGERRALKAVALLLSYPGYRALAASLAKARGLPGAARRHLAEFAEAVRPWDELTLAARYVEAFDFSSQGTLSLTYQELGDARTRGLALWSLLAELRRHGYAPGPGQAPDSVPLLLEFLSVREDATSDDPLAQRLARALSQIREHLARDEASSLFVPLLSAALAVLPADTAPSPQRQEKTMAEDDVPFPLQAIP
jgi:nitrate reductase delta subunit